MNKFTIRTDDKGKVKKALWTRGFVPKWKDGFLIVADSNYDIIFDILNDNNITFL